MSINVFISAALLALVFLQSIIATGTSISLLRTTTTPIEVVDSFIINSDVGFGDDLVVKRVYDKNAYCKVDIDRFILKLPDNLVVRRERIPAGITKLGRETILVHIPTKSSSKMEQTGGKTSINEAELEIGSEYLLREFIHSDCGDRLHTINLPDLRFNVVAGPTLFRVY